MGRWRGLDLNTGHTLDPTQWPLLMVRALLFMIHKCWSRSSPGPLLTGHCTLGNQGALNPHYGEAHFEQLRSHFKLFLVVNWTKSHQEAYAPLSYPKGRPLQPINLLSKPTRDVTGYVRQGSHSALGCQGVHYGQDKYRPFSHFHFILSFRGQDKNLRKTKMVS